MLFARVVKFVQKPLQIIFGFSYKNGIVSIVNNVETSITLFYLFIFFMTIIIYFCLEYGLVRMWQIPKEEKGRLMSFEQRCYRRMMRISWRGRVANEEVFRRTGELNVLRKAIKSRRDILIGHTLNSRELTQSCTCLLYTSRCV